MHGTLRCLTLIVIGCTVALWPGKGLLAQEAQVPPTPGAAPAPAAAPDAAPAAAPEAAAPAAPAVAPEAGSEAVLVQHVDDFWHFAKVARYDLAAAAGQEILKLNAKPVDLLNAFEKVTGEAEGPTGPEFVRQDVMVEWLLRWQQEAAMKSVTTKLMSLLEEGRRARCQNPNWICQNIEALAVNERAFNNHMANLRQTGELAVPFMVQYLRDGSKRELQSVILRGLTQLGRVALNPLVASTEMRDPHTLVLVCTALGEIGYPDAAPYLARLANSPETNGAVRQAAAAALAQLSAVQGKSLDAANMFYDLGQRFYYNNASIVPDLKMHVAYVWYWDDEKGLTKKDVPPGIFSDLMAARSCEYALRLDPNQGRAISLWVAAQFKRDVDLAGAGAGAVDTTRAPGQPDSTFYAKAAGVQYLESVVDRAMHDKNAAVALAAIKSLEQIAGQVNLFDSPHQPIINALGYSDRVVRFEAADALASALPQKRFTGQEQVIPILAEALQQSGKSMALVLVPSQDQLNLFISQLKTAGYIAKGGTTPQDAMSQAIAMPGIDVVIISEEVAPAQRDEMEQLMSQNLKLRQTAKVFITATQSATPYAARAAVDPLVNVTTARTAAGLSPVLSAARQRSGALPINEKLATEYALKSAGLLGKLAISRGQVLDLMVARLALLGALDDSRIDVAKAAANVLSVLNSKDIQAGLLSKAVDSKTNDDLKIALYKSLATNARFFGNELDQPGVQALTKVVESTVGAPVRTAAAEAFGALDLPPDQSRVLILQQSHTAPTAAPVAQK